MNILVIAPHPDDEIIGVGGTIFKNIDIGNNVYVAVITKGAEPLFSDESVKKTREETIKCHREAGIKETFFLDFPAAMLETVSRYKINDEIIGIVKKIQPNEVYIPHFGDMQKDHRIVVDSAMVALRPKYSFAPAKILAYETLSETGWNVPSCGNEFIPNVYVDISAYLEKKLNAMKIYESQLGAYPDARSLEAIKALAQYRGSVMNLHAAEAFMLIREIN